MNLLHVITAIDPKDGGTTTALRNILHVESMLGIHHEVLTMQSGAADQNILELASVYRAQPSFPEHYARTLDAIRWLKRNIDRFDLVVIHGIWSWLPWKATKILSKLQKPYLIYPHGSLDPFDLRKKKIAKKILGPLVVRKMLDRAAAVVCTTLREAQRVERYGAHPIMETLPLPVPFSKEKKKHRGFRAKWGLLENDFLFLFLSRINYKKGLDILIPAFGMLAGEYENIKLIVAGSDREGYGDLVRQWVVERNIQSKVIFPGFLQGEEKESLMAESNCFVLPSLNENFALAVVEALGTGLPVIISRNVYIEEDITRFNAGWVCDFSVNSLYETMKNIILNPDDYREKKRATIFAAEYYSPECVGEKYLAMYEKVLLRY